MRHFQFTLQENTHLQPKEKFNYLRDREWSLKINRRTWNNQQKLWGTHQHFEGIIQQQATDTGCILYSIGIYATSYKKTAYIRRIYDTVEQYFRSLQSLDEDINKRQTNSLIDSKLPEVKIVRLEQKDVD